MFKKIRTFNDDHDVFLLFYNASIHASDVNSAILQSTYNKVLLFNSKRFSLKNLGYDAEKMSVEFDKLHELVESIESDRPSSKKIVGYFATVHSELRKLNSAVHATMRDLDVRVAESQKTIV